MKVKLGRKFPGIRHKWLVPFCPYCGQIHRKTRLRLLALALFFIAAWIGFLTPDAQASLAIEYRPEASNQADPITGKYRNPFPSQIAAISPTPTMRFPVETQPSPTPLPIPHTGIIWSPTSNGVYFYSKPGVDILIEIPNGTFVHLLDEFAVYGNLPWIRIRFEAQEGWIEATQVSRLRHEEETFFLVSDLEGTYLYTTPQGPIIIWLPFGTPLRFQAEIQNSWGWVETLTGEAGWVIWKKVLPPD